MTKSASTKYPLESFGPELMTVLLKGSREKVVLKFEGPDGAGKRKAHLFHRRIHTLRSKMRQADHPDHPIAAKTLVSIYWGQRAVEEGDTVAPKEWTSDVNGKRGAIIVLRPRDSEFDDVLREAGITIPKSEPPKPYVGASHSMPADEAADLENFMDDLVHPSTGDTHHE